MSDLQPRIVGDEEIAPIENFRPNTWNANRMTEHQMRSLEHELLVTGWLRSQKLLIWRTDEKGQIRNIIIDGEHRWLAGRNVGFKEAPVVHLDGLTEDEAKMLTIKIDQKRGKWDPLGIAKLVEEVKQKTSDTALELGFTPLELSDMSKSIAKQPPAKPAASTTPAATEDNVDEIPEPPKQPIAKFGELWEVGKHLLVVGDSFDIKNRDRVFKHLEIKSIDLVLTDPPFAIYGSSSGISSDVADDKMIEPFFTEMWRTILSYAREFAHFYIHCDWRSFATIWNTAKAQTVVPKNMLVWDKGGSGLGSNYANTHELIYFGAKLPPLTAMRSTGRRGQRTVHAPNVLRYPRPHGEDRLHNAAKPVGLLKELLKNSLEEGETVVDFFGGSGSTMLASEQLGFRNVTFEKDPRNADIILARLEKRAGLKPSLVKKSKAA